MEHVDWTRSIHEALEHLHSRAYLAAHPLARVFGSEQQPASADVVRRTLLEAIEQLKPVADMPSGNADWRRYRQMILRYVEGKTLEQAARDLGISARQASRDHQQAIAALASLIQAASSRGQFAIPATLAEGTSPPTDRTGAPSLAEEAAKVAASEEEQSDLAHGLRSVLALIEQLADDRAVSFEVSLGGVLPPVAIGPTLLRQALLNLLLYACDTAPGQRLALSATDTARGVILRIDGRRHPSLDGGPAVPTDASHLLLAAQQLLGARGGQIEPGDGRGTGVLLRVILPPIPLRGVLVVDDNPELASLFRRYLLHEPYRVIQAISGSRAVSLARELHPDVIILDVLIPSQDGWEILQRLREDPATKRTPVIISSVLPEQKLARSLGVDAFLSKPVSRSTLLATLRQWCSDPVAPRGRPGPSA